VEEAVNYNFEKISHSLPDYARYAWWLPALASVVSFFVLWAGMSAATSAIQEATVAALSCAIVVIPYVFCRAVDRLAGHE